MLTRFTSRVARSVKRFHEDEGGNESLQTILIMAVGAMVMVGLYKIWDGNIKGEVITKIKDLFAVIF